jgi:hypothetical protein
MKPLRKEIRASKRGGLWRLEYLLRLRPGEPQSLPLDVVFVSIDLEGGITDGQSTQAPLVKEVGIAKLDTRDLFPAALKHPTTKLISTVRYSTTHSSADFKDCDFTDFKECLFAETYSGPQKNLALILLQIPFVLRTKTLWILFASGISFLLVTQLGKT